MFSALWLPLTAVLFSDPAEPLRYQVTPARDLSSVRIAITVPCAGKTVDLTMPSWSPGYYILENFGDSLKSVTAASDDGTVRPVSHPAPDTWHVDTFGAKSVTISYIRQILHESGRRGIFSGDPETVHYDGTSI